MISIIVSTYQPEKFEQFKYCVENTIGDVAYEIVRIDNPGLMGICEAYNIGIEKSKYPYICFCHDDIIFITKNWGSILINIFQDNPDLGLIGCAGSTYKAWVPSGWSLPDDKYFVKLNFIQAKSDGREIEYISKNMMLGLEPVAALDGCWLCTKKEVTDQYKFDDHIFKNYHCYDIDYSLQVLAEYKIAVVKDILIKHCSDGNFSLDWLIETYKLHAKWKNLPISVSTVTKMDVIQQEKIAYSFLLAKTFEFNSGCRKLFKVLFSKRFINLIKFKEWFTVFRWTAAGLLKSKINKR